jgi:hypothetical protein
MRLMCLHWISVVHILGALTNFVLKFIRKSETYDIIDITFPAPVEIFMGFNRYVILHMLLETRVCC